MLKTLVPRTLPNITGNFLTEEKMKIIVYLLIVYAMASIVKTQPGNETKKRCGEVLTNFMSKLCKTYAEPDLREKKSDGTVF